MMKSLLSEYLTLIRTPYLIQLLSRFCDNMCLLMGKEDNHIEQQDKYSYKEETIYHGSR